MKTEFELKDDISFLPEAELRAAQDKLLSEQIRYCRENSPFYRKKLADLPGDMMVDFDSLQQLPTTSKSDLAEHNEEFFALPMEQISTSPLYGWGVYPDTEPVEWIEVKGMDGYTDV